ncbi:hypothetical protein [Chitinophaga rhizophila]|uniref:Uncharacterized protein n=1 Tax=Chitinophaga rhizophila TaxID=2866212 RepID=A0ABS7G6D1_9BACT|nr:hypothetical protein [Chitinophaga rhizophila]MBW8683016.1 hypothetical protein [Chitinophaga rhizophila]
MSEKILVPIKIEALIVDKVTARDTAYNWKNFYIDYDGLFTRLGTYMEPGELKELNRGGFCEKGIHLHWALPAALTNGIQQDGKTVFPAVPNRWLVIRTHFVNGQPVIKKWILESDYIGPYLSDKSTWAIQNPDGSFSTSHNIGKATVLDNWTVEQPRSTIPLTAIAPGNPTFAGIYQYCRNVFGLWDDLSGLDNTAATYSYLVTGWYSDPAIEPLINADQVIIDNIRSKWQVSGTLSDSILCHGFIHSVTWDPARLYSLPVNSAAVNTGIGLTAVEAKTAQLSRQTGAAEKLLNGYFYDILKDTVDAITLDTLVDNQTYTSFDGGTLWEIVHREKDTDAKEGRDTPQPAFPDPETNPGLSEAFKAINMAQQAADRLFQQRRSLMLEFRALCDKIIMATADNNQVLLARLTADRNRLQADIDAMTTTMAGQQAIVTTQQNLMLQMPAFVSLQEKPAQFELKQKKMPRYWQANDPTLLFSGPGVTGSTKYKHPGKGDKLPCRLATELIADIILNDNTTGEGRTISPGNTNLGLKELGSLKNNILLITQLYAEAILFDPAWALVWAQQYYKDSPGNNANTQALAAYLKNILQLVAQTPTGKFKGVILRNGTIIRPTAWTLDALSELYATRGIQQWKHPWTPLYLIWYAKFIPSYSQTGGQWQYKQEDWQWKDKKYLYVGGTPDTTKAIEYSGKVLLTDMLTDLCKQQLPANVDAGQHLSQTIGSFSDALLMRQESIQLPLLKNPADTKWKLIRDHSLDNYITNDAYFFPDVSGKSGGAANFFPIGAGHLQFTRLWITDAFGQVQKVVDINAGGSIVKKGHIHIAENLNHLSNSFQVTLSPRLAQPARLLFRWCSAQSELPVESSNDPETNPVCGWLLPDHLDQSLDVYATSGLKCGALRMISVDGRPQLQWSNPPGTALKTTPEDAITNRYLLGFVNGLLNYRDNEEQPTGGAALRSLFELCNQTALFLSTSSGQQAPGIAGIMGQPVALVRASLKMELQGLPAQPQHYEHTITEESKTKPPGLVNLSFPVALGDARNNKDGLIGYFKDNGKGFSEMHIPYGMPKPASPYFSSDDVRLAFNADPSLQAITLLMDPRGGVQADAGILPVKYIDLPDTYTGGLKHMELDMLAAPILGAGTVPFIPLGTEPERQWIFKQQLPTGDWQQTNIDNQNHLQSGSINTQMIHEGYLSLSPATNEQQ